MRVLPYVTDQDGRRSRWSILNRHQNPGVVCLLLVGMQIPMAADMEAQAIRLLIKRDDDVSATGVPGALSEFVESAFRLPGRGVF